MSTGEGLSAVREHRPLPLADGRRLTWCEIGPAQATTTVLYLHGSGSSRLEVAAYGPSAERLGVRMVAWDRPRAGGSTAQPGRRVTDVVADARAVAEAAGVQRPAVVGLSGGGTHVLALAATAPDVISRAVAVNPGPPPHEDVLALLGRGTAGPIRLVTRSPRAFGAVAAVSQSRNPLMRRFVRSRVDAGDRAVLDDPVVGPLFELSAAEGRRQRGAWVEEARMFWDEPWSFGLDSFAVPLDVFTGESDGFAPFARSLAEGGATVHPFPGGHISGFTPEVMDAVLATAATPTS